MPLAQNVQRSVVAEIQGLIEWSIELLGCAAEYIQTFRAASQVMDHTGHDAPDLELHVRLNLKRRIGAIVGHEIEFACASGEAFDGQFAVQDGDDDACVLWFERAVNDEYVAGMDAGVNHRIAGDADEEGGGRMLDQMAIEIEPAFDVVLCGRRETG